MQSTNPLIQAAVEANAAPVEAGALPRLSERSPRGIHCPSDIAFALGVSLIWAVLYNLRFWEQAMRAMWQPTFGAALFMASLAVVVIGLQSVLVLLMPTRLTMRIATSALFVVAALSSYFANAYGAVMNQDMMRNVLGTDPAEVGGLLNFDLLGHLLLLGVLPAILVWQVALPAAGWRIRLKHRAIFIPGALAICVAAMFTCSANYAVFLREHKPVRFTLSPSAPVVSLATLISSGHDDPDRPLANPAGNAHYVGAARAKPLVLFLVIGETARAGDFQLGGYPRATNPRLQGLDNLVYFAHTLSCGTSTAVSVPCLFSHLDRDRFDVDEAGDYTNLLDSLAQAGFDVEWRDNNAGCKGVCARVAQVDYGGERDARLCPQSYCYDEIMLNGLSDRLRKLERDTVIVFHQIGSHGPAYAQRYPARFEVFKPACRSNELQHCSAQEIVNAYDNTIVYTDYVLSRQIALLRAASDRVDSALIYVSDHGESLGEQGIYLHGMPYGFAPDAQKEVPMLMWASDGYVQRLGLRPGCLRSQAQKSWSHDNFYHTVLGAAEVRNRLYDPRLDILAECRGALLSSTQ